jgi:serine protease Do
MKWTRWMAWTVLCLALPAASSAQQLSEERGYDRRGNDYHSFRARGLGDCQDACARDGRCRAYTFDTRNGDCYLKDRVNSGERNGVMVTGYKEERRDRADRDRDRSDQDRDRDRDRDEGGRRQRLSEEPGRDRKGDDYTSFRARDLRECKRECRDDDRCQAYTFLERSHMCYLKSRINSGVRNRGAVTGYKERY